MTRYYMSIILLISLFLVSPAFSIDLGQELLKGLSQQAETKKAGTDTVYEEDEQQLGRQIAGNLLGAAPLVKDKALQKYVNDVGRWVANQGGRPDVEWHFGVVESDDINAFAMPGGYIIVTKGLYKLLKNEAQLAGVLAHEIGHVVRKHHYRVLRQARLVEFGSKLLSEQAGKDNQLLQRLIGSGAEVVARGLDKSAEFEADRMGVVLAARAGYDLYGLPEVLERIGHVAKEDDSVMLLFKTHPHPDERIGRLGESMGDRLDGISGQTVEKRFYRLKR